MKQSADGNFEFDVNSRKFSKLVENTVGKGEIAHYEQFLLFPKCFQKACFPGVSKGVIVWEWVNHKSIVSAVYVFKTVESKTTSDWLSHEVLPIRSCYFNYKIYEKKTKNFLENGH